MTRIVAVGAIDVDAELHEALRAKAPDVGAIEAVGSVDELGTVVAEGTPVVGIAYENVVLTEQAALTGLLGSGSPDNALVAVLTTDNSSRAGRILLDGANGVVLASSPAEELITALRAVAAGYLFVPSRYLAELSETLFALACRRHGASGDVQLTRRECDVLSIVALGEPNSEIANKLYISEATVRSHVLNILRKLGVRNSTEAVAIGYRSGMLYRGAGEYRHSEGHVTGTLQPQ